MALITSSIAVFCAGVIGIVVDGVFASNLLVYVMNDSITFAFNRVFVEFLKLGSLCENWRKICPLRSKKAKWHRMLRSSG